MANPEIIKMKQRIQEYKETHPEYDTPAPPKPPRRKLLRPGRKFTGTETCAYCGKKLTRHNATFDHVIPLCRGGTNDKENLVWCCRECNHRKGSKLLSEWMEGKNDVF